jgi:ribosomal-protein-serine acetyltransferase
MTLLNCPLSEDEDLVLREMGTVGLVHELTLKNLERLKSWEPWAHAEQTMESSREYTKHVLGEWVEGRALPLLIRRHGQIVGSIGARIDDYFGAAELGFWIDADAEGQGLVRRSAERVIRHLFDDGQLRRIEIRTAAHNTRSRALSERLGFTLDGVLRQAIQVGDEAHDVALYSLLASESPRQPDRQLPSTV